MAWPIIRHILNICTKKVIKKISGEENIPKNGAFLIAANHASYLDPLLIIKTVLQLTRRKVHFMARRQNTSMNFWFLGDMFCRKWAACIPVWDNDNGKSALQEATDILKSGEIVGIFPNVVVRGKQKVATGVTRLALAAHVPIVPIFIKNAEKIFPPYAKKPISYKKIIELYIGSPITLERYYEKKLSLEQLRSLTLDIMKKVHSLRSS